MPKVTVCVRFRPLSPKEGGDTGRGICVNKIDFESFAIKDEKDADIRYCFDRVFHYDSTQADIYDFLAAPIVQDAISGINGTIIMYGQTGAGKTYSMEGPSFVGSDDHEKGILQRVLDELFEHVKSVDEEVKYTVKVSMVEIYMEKVRDLLDLTKDNLQIKEAKLKGIYIDGATEIFVQTSAEALLCLSTGISNRAVGETQMNASSSRSHCMYIFSVQEECSKNGQVKSGKLVLVDLAGSEKVDKTRAEGRILDEAKTINKSLSALGNVIKALTKGKVNHIPYRDSKLTRILQDALGGNSRTALLCCCSPSSINQSESLSTIRFGARAKLIKLPVMVDIHNPLAAAGQVISGIGSESQSEVQQCIFGKSKELSVRRVLAQLKDRLDIQDLKLLEDLLILEGIVYDPCSVLVCEREIEYLNSLAVEMLQQELQCVHTKARELENENKLLKTKIEVLENAGMTKLPLVGVINWLWDGMGLVKL